MKSIKKLMLGAVICFTALLNIVPVYAQDVNVYEGETIVDPDPVIELGMLQSTEGVITLDDPNGILDLDALTIASNFAGSINLSNGRTYLYTGGAAANATITFNVSLNSGAAAGSCATFTYAAEGVTGEDGNYSSSDMREHASVCVVKRPDTPAPTPTPDPTPSTPSKPATGVKVNYVGLFNQIDVAETLILEYSPLSVALNSAKKLMAEKNQDLVDLVAAMLEVIIAGVN